MQPSGIPEHATAPFLVNIDRTGWRGYPDADAAYAAVDAYADASARPDRWPVFKIAARCSDGNYIILEEHG